MAAYNITRATNKRCSFPRSKTTQSRRDPRNRDKVADCQPVGMKVIIKGIPVGRVVREVNFGEVVGLKLAGL